MDNNKTTTAQPETTEKSRCSLKWDLILASFLVLFMEVMFIRWVPSYERVLAYFTNFVLLAAVSAILLIGASQTVYGGC